MTLKNLDKAPPALLVACAVCDDTAGGGVQLDVVSSTRRRWQATGPTREGPLPDAYRYVVVYLPEVES